MARNTSPQDDDIIDLTELIETGGASSRTAPPPDSDFEDLLAGAEAGDGARGQSSAQRPVNPDEELDMVNMGDIDNLLESLDIPPQPRESAPPPKPAPAAPKDNLDSVLDDLLGPEPGVPAAQAQPEPPARDSFIDDLDAILGDEGGAPPARPKTPAAPPKTAPPDNIDADLDNLLGDLDEPAPPKAAAQPKPQPKMPADDAGLDDILSGLDEPPAPKPKPAAPKPQPAPEPEINLDAELDDILAEVEPPAPPVEAKKAAPGPKLEAPKNQDVLLDEPDSTVADIAPQPVAAIQAAPVVAQGMPQELIAGICQNVMSARDTSLQDSLNGFSRQMGAQGAHMEDMARQMAELGKRLVACEAKLAASRSRVTKLEKSMEAVATLEDLLKDGTSLHAGFTALISSAVGQALKGFSDQREPDPAAMARLQSLQDAQQSASERMDMLEKRLDEMQAGLDSRVESIALAAASHALKEYAPEEAPGQETMARLARLAEKEKYSAARMDMLEKRLDELEPNFNAQVEKAAAAAAARILHEEIGKLAAGL